MEELATLRKGNGEEGAGGAIAGRVGRDEKAMGEVREK